MQREREREVGTRWTLFVLVGYSHDAGIGRHFRNVIKLLLHAPHRPLLTGAHGRATGRLDRRHGDADQRDNGN